MKIKNRSKAGVFLKISGFLPQEVDDIIYRTKAVKQALKDKKSRLRIEKHWLNFGNPKICQFTKANSVKQQRNDAQKPRKPWGEKRKEQIDNGFNLVKKWQKEAKEKQTKDGELDIKTKIVGIRDPESEAYTDCKTYIALNIVKMITQCSLLNMNFDHFFCQCMSHEYIHCILYKYVSLEAASTFDTICTHKDMREMKRFAPDTWHGGIPWRK